MLLMFELTPEVSMPLSIVHKDTYAFIQRKEVTVLENKVK